MDDFIQYAIQWTWPVFASLSGGLIALYREKERLTIWSIIKMMCLSIITGLFIGSLVGSVVVSLIDRMFGPVTFGQEIRHVSMLSCAFGFKHIFEGIEKVMIKFSKNPVDTIKSIWKGSQESKKPGSK